MLEDKVWAREQNAKEVGSATTLMWTSADI
jgi:hypothetical protein